jgi:hypothetical protein
LHQHIGNDDGKDGMDVGFGPSPHVEVLAPINIGKASAKGDITNAYMEPMSEVVDDLSPGNEIWIGHGCLRESLRQRARLSLPDRTIGRNRTRTRHLSV